MFKHIHHRTWFPAVVVGLSLFLLLFIAWAYNNHRLAINESVEVPAITFEQYQNKTSDIFKDFWNQYRGQSDSAAAAKFITDIEQQMLALRVPAEGQPVHLELVSGLELMRQGLVGDEEKKQVGLERLENVLNENPWIVSE